MVAVHTFNSTTQKVEEDGSLSFLTLRPALFMEWVPGWPEIHQKNLCLEKQKQQQQNVGLSIEMCVIVVVVLQICSYVNIEHSVHMKQMHQLYVNYTLIIGIDRPRGETQHST